MSHKSTQDPRRERQALANAIKYLKLSRQYFTVAEPQLVVAAEEAMSPELAVLRYRLETFDFRGFIAELDAIYAQAMRDAGLNLGISRDPTRVKLETTSND